MFHLDCRVQQQAKNNLNRGATGIFFWGGIKSFFLIFFPAWNGFFPVENSHFGRPKTNFRRFQKWKAKKKKKKKRSSPQGFYTFSYFHFQVSTFPFTIFLLFISIITLIPFFLAYFFPICQQKFPGQKSLGDTLPPCYATDLKVQNFGPCNNGKEILNKGNEFIVWKGNRHPWITSAQCITFV